MNCYCIHANPCLEHEIVWMNDHVYVLHGLVCILEYFPFFFLLQSNLLYQLGEETWY